MQVLITHSALARTRVLQFQRWQLLLAGLALVFVLLALSGAVYHFIFLKAAREGWPVVSALVRPIVREEIERRDLFVRDNLDAMALKLGEMQAKLVKLEAMGERVSGLAGMKPEDLKPLQRGGGLAGPAAGKGGPYVSAVQPSLAHLRELISGLDEAADVNLDLFTYLESQLQETRLSALMVPSAPPVDGPVGSGFGFRIDPLNGRSALHSGLDFPAEVGTRIVAAAGGIVVSTERHPEYGLTLEIDHGNGLITRYAHCSRIDVQVGALVKRGQPVALVGNSGRSTGSHLHFEVLVGGVPRDPARFLAAGANLTPEVATRRGRR